MFNTLYKKRHSLSLEFACKQEFKDKRFESLWWGQGPSPVWQLTWSDKMASLLFLIFMKETQKIGEAFVFTLICIQNPRIVSRWENQWPHLPLWVFIKAARSSNSRKNFAYFSYSFKGQCCLLLQGFILRREMRKKLSYHNEHLNYIQHTVATPSGFGRRIISKYFKKQIFGLFLGQKTEFI